MCRQSRQSFETEKAFLVLQLFYISPMQLLFWDQFLGKEFVSDILHAKYSQ